MCYRRRVEDNSLCHPMSLGDITGLYNQPTNSTWLVWRAYHARPLPCYGSIVWTGGIVRSSLCEDENESLRQGTGRPRMEQVQVQPSGANTGNILCSWHNTTFRSGYCKSFVFLSNITQPSSNFMTHCKLECASRLSKTKTNNSPRRQMKMMSGLITSWMRRLVGTTRI